MVLRRAHDAGVVLATVLVLLALGGGRARAAVELPLPSDAAVAAASGHVLWATELANHTIAIMASDVAGSPPVQLADIPELRHTRHTEIALAANALGYELVVRDLMFEYAGDPVGTVAIAVGDQVLTGAYDGSTSQIASCVPAGAPMEGYDVPMVAAAADAGGYAYAGVDCAGGSGVHIVNADGTVTTLMPASHDSADFLLAGGGQWFAFATSNVPLTVVDLTRGAPREQVPADAPAPSGIAVGADGALALTAAGSGVNGDPVWVRSAGGGSFHQLAGAVAAEHTQQALATDAGRLLYATNADYGAAVTPLAGGPSPPVTAPGAGFPVTVVGLSGDRALLTSQTCTGAKLQLTVVDLTAPAPGPAAAGCPILYGANTRTLRVGPHGTLSLPLRCPYGCDTAQVSLDLVAGTLPRRTIDGFLDGSLAVPVFSLAPGSGIVHVRLDRQALRLLAAHRSGLPVNLDSTSPGPSATLVQTYRLRILPAVPHRRGRRRGRVL